MNHPDSLHFLTINENSVEYCPNIVITQHVSHWEGNGRSKKLKHVNEDNFVLTSIRCLKLAPSDSL